MIATGLKWEKGICNKRELVLPAAAGGAMNGKLHLGHLQKENWVGKIRAEIGDRKKNPMKKKRVPCRQSRSRWVSGEGGDEKRKCSERLANQRGGNQIGVEKKKTVTGRRLSNSVEGERGEGHLKTKRACALLLHI